MLPPGPFCSPSPGRANKQSQGGCGVVAWGDEWENPRGSVLELLPSPASAAKAPAGGAKPRCSPELQFGVFIPPPLKKKPHI